MQLVIELNASFATLLIVFFTVIVMFFGYYRIVSSDKRINNYQKEMAKKHFNQTIWPLLIVSMGTVMLIKATQRYSDRLYWLHLFSMAVFYIAVVIMLLSTIIKQKRMVFPLIYYFYFTVVILVYAIPFIVIVHFV
jgi:cell division protein FtsW (lipid II flippase)